MSTPVYLEIGKKRVFACAPDWPGWCRSGRDEEQALAALAEYGSRYAVVARNAGLTFEADAAASFDVVERVQGTSTTDFGAPDVAIDADREPKPPDELERYTAILAAAWRSLERAVARAPESLAKGPRGGGRDRDRVVEHVLGAEVSYARTVGVRGWKAETMDAAATAAFREALLTALRSPDQTEGNRWPLPYAARRIAWHVLDHVWEIEDRGGLAPERAW